VIRGDRFFLSSANLDLFANPPTGPTLEERGPSCPRPDVVSFSAWFVNQHICGLPSFYPIGGERGPLVHLLRANCHPPPHCLQIVPSTAPLGQRTSSPPNFDQTGQNVMVGAEGQHGNCSHLQEWYAAWSSPSVFTKPLAFTPLPASHKF